MRTSRNIALVALTVSLLASACGSTPPESLANAETTTTTAAVDSAADGAVETAAAAGSEVDEQVSGDAQPISSNEPETDNGASTPEDETPEVTTTTEAETPEENTTTTAPVETCEAPELTAFYVDVALDDPDGGLNVRSGPGTSNAVVDTFARGKELIPTGECEVVGSTEWWAVNASDGFFLGWTSSRFLTDVQLFDPELGASMADTNLIGFEAGSIEELVELLADNLGFDDDRVITFIDGGGIDAIGAEGTWDITGLKDDSIGGYQVHIGYDFVKDENAENVLGVIIRRVDKAPLCNRGVTPDGLCI